MTKKSFLDLLRESVIISGAISLALVVTSCYLWATGGAVPDELYYSLVMVLGFFFGGKAQKATGK